MVEMDAAEICADAGELQDAFNFSNVRKIFTKDWKEMRYNRQLFLSVLLFPLFIAVGIPLLMWGMLLGDGTPPTEFYAFFSVAINGMMKSQFMLIPVLICGMISGDSLAGEKERKTAESLVVLPVTSKEIFVGKALAALVPALFFTGIGFAIMSLVSNLLVLESIQAGLPLLIIGERNFWVIPFVLSPLFALVMVQVGVMISARLSTAKSAQQVSMIFMIPIMVLMFMSIANPEIISDIGFLLVLSVILLSIAILFANFGGKAINKERFIATLG